MRILVWIGCGYFFLSALGTIFFVYPDAWPEPVPMTCAEAVAADKLPSAVRLSECAIDPRSSLVVEEKFILDKGRGERVGGFLALTPTVPTSQPPRLFVRSDRERAEGSVVGVFYRESTGDAFAIERELSIGEAIVLNTENTQPAGFIVLFAAILAVVSLVAGAAYEFSQRSAPATSQLSSLRG